MANGCFWVRIITNSVYTKPRAKRMLLELPMVSSAGEWLPNRNAGSCQEEF